VATAERKEREVKRVKDGGWRSEGANEMRQQQQQQRHAHSAPRCSNASRRRRRRRL